MDRLLWNASHIPLVASLDIQRLFRSPSDILRIIFSLLKSTPLSVHRQTISDLRRSPQEFEEHLSLGEDVTEEGVAKRATSETWRSRVESWPVLAVDELEGPSLKRAHLLLAWLVHYYVHSIPPTDEPVHVPACLAIPLVEVSTRLGIAPILTFADTVLWNWDLIDESLPVSIENINFQNLFSGTEDERSFYIASAMAEFRGIEMLRIIDDYNRLPDLTGLPSISKVLRLLTRLKVIIEDISDIVQSVRPNCDPHTFFFDIRPWYEGADAQGPSAPGWIFDGVPNSDLLYLSGPSAGQSSVMHALDIFLDIDHKLKQRRSPAPSPANKQADHGFMERMRRYMPGKHQEYLAHLAATPRSIRELAQKVPAVREPYDNAVMALKKLRDLHIRIACLYIVTMSKTVPEAPTNCPAGAMMERLQASRVKGKGPLSILLKAGRDATRRAVLRN
ncbi:Indoleamine 2,3-dioxygenase [Mycena floridula]|nr:Indoleamine 2,3-dioxygenase [Mycena floridula]